MWNPRWRPRNGCDGRLMVKILIPTIQVSFVPKPTGTKFTWIVIIKIFTINLLSQPFLGRHLWFHIFFHHSLFGGYSLFLQLGCFGLDRTILDRTIQVVKYIILGLKFVEHFNYLFNLKKIDWFPETSEIPLEYAWVEHPFIHILSKGVAREGVSKGFWGIPSKYNIAYKAQKWIPWQFKHSLFWLQPFSWIVIHTWNTNNNKLYYFWIKGTESILENTTN